MMPSKELNDELLARVRQDAKERSNLAQGKVFTCYAMDGQIIATDLSDMKMGAAVTICWRPNPPDDDPRPFAYGVSCSVSPDIPFEEMNSGMGDELQDTLNTDKECDMARYRLE
ncbi:MAG: hypothetical protein ABIP54_04845, partial [Candidatus Andersenbacteria bacterium]